MSKPAIDLTPRVVVSGVRTFGPGKADLLDVIARTGSISAAARDLRMSYSRAWTLVDEMNRAFRSPLVESSTGGKSGGGARVTTEGAKVLALYRRMQTTLDAEAAAFAPRFRALLK
jgi:molybdate transport system regulatory protein